MNRDLRNLARNKIQQGPSVSNWIKELGGLECKQWVAPVTIVDLKDDLVVVKAKFPNSSSTVNYPLPLKQCKRSINDHYTDKSMVNRVYLMMPKEIYQEMEDIGLVLI